MSSAIDVFDRRAVRLHRDRAASGLERYDFLLREVGDRLLDRLDDVRRSFPVVLDIGCGRGDLARHLLGRPGVHTLVQCDLSAEMVRHAPGLKVAADEEALPFAAASFDLVINALSLHWVNDLPGALLQLRQMLRPDGLLLAAMLGGETLKELRRSLSDAEIAVEGGLSPRISPFADVRDVGNLLQRAGFALPIADVETITVSYPDPLALLADLRGMGETNAVAARRKSGSRRQTVLAALTRYKELYAGSDGRVPATFQVVFMAAWGPDPSQPRALRPGSAAARLADALGTAEIPTGERAKP
jgi:NADH dehydrogenase [ubiquinone] 1 alpha subcomplex assembly factor 5